MTVKKYKFINESKVIYEITWKQYDKVKNVVKGIGGGSLSFYGIFGPKDTRVMFPLKSVTTTTEKDEFLKFFENNGYDIDLKNGLATNELEIPEGPKKGQKQKRSIKIGKLLQNTNNLIDSLDELQKKSASEDEIEQKYKILKKLYPVTFKKYSLFEDYFTSLSSVFKEKVEKHINWWNKNSEYYFVYKLNSPLLI
jgi:hypothetical protein